MNVFGFWFKRELDYVVNLGKNVAKCIYHAYRFFSQVTLTNRQWQSVFVEFGQRERNWKLGCYCGFSFQSIFSILYSFIVCKHGLCLVFSKVNGQSIKHRQLLVQKVKQMLKMDKLLIMEVLGKKIINLSMRYSKLVLQKFFRREGKLHCTLEIWFLAEYLFILSSCAQCLNAS